MGKTRKIKLSFKVDKLTSSIKNTISGDVFQTKVSLLQKSDLIKINKKLGWEFDWRKEVQFPDKEIYKLTINDNPHIIQGLVSLSLKENSVFMNLHESAPFNRGKNKIYVGVPGNLVAFVCKLSFQRGYDGYVSFISKSKLVQHYIDILGAINLGGNIMLINTDSAIKLINKYFKD